MSDDYTPTIGEVRDLFIYGAWEGSRNGCDDDLNGAEFDRWLAADRKVQRAEAVRQELIKFADWIFANDVEDWSEVIREARTRADRIEGGDQS